MKPNTKQIEAREFVEWLEACTERHGANIYDAWFNYARRLMFRPDVFPWLYPILNGFVCFSNNDADKDIAGANYERLQIDKDFALYVNIKLVKKNHDALREKVTRLNFGDKKE
jgi:hypothetical protein